MFPETNPLILGARGQNWDTTTGTAWALRAIEVIVWAELVMAAAMAPLEMDLLNMVAICLMVSPW